MSTNDENIAAFFQDPDASSAIVLAAQHVAAPMVQGAPLTMEETMMMGGGLRIAHFVLDASPSMIDVAELLRNGFNDDFVPAVKEARENDISVLRIGGAAFSSGPPTPIWKGANGDYYHTLDDLPSLTDAAYDPYRGSGTDLHRAILEETARVLTAAAELENQTGMNVDVDIIILSDGANNGAPRNPDEVKRVITGRDKSRVRYLFLYFETDWGMPEPKEYATNELGIDGEQVLAFLRDSNETPEQQAHRFRQLMQVMSKVSASRGTSAVMAASAALPDDDEIV